MKKKGNPATADESPGSERPLTPAGELDAGGDEQRGRVAYLFRVLFDWDLRIELHKGAGEPTLYTVSADDDDDDDPSSLPVVLLDRVTLKTLEEWIRQRQAHELYDHLPPNGVILLTGAPTAGKTSTALRLALEAQESGPVIYAALEHGEAQIQERISDLGQDLNTVVVGALPRLNEDPCLLDVLEQHIRTEIPASMVILDSLAYIRPGGDSEGLANALEQVEAFAVAQDVQILVIHHSRPDGGVDLSPLVSTTLRQALGGECSRLALALPGETSGFRLISETSGGMVDLGVRPSIDGTGAKVYTITETNTGEALLTNASLATVRAWARPDPLQAVLTRIAAATAALTAASIDLDAVKEQLAELTTEVLNLATGEGNE